MNEPEDFIPRDAGSVGDLTLTNAALLPFLGLAVLLILGHFAGSAGWLSLTTTALLWAGGCLISGAALGFLFSIPRVVQSPNGASHPTSGENDKNGAVDAGPVYHQQVNTNLIEISDWLTKIFVGLGLIELKKLPVLVDRTARTLASGLQFPPGTESVRFDNYAFATALILTFTVLGFFMGYLYTRLFLASAFSRADGFLPRDRNARKLLVQVKELVDKDVPAGPEDSRQMGKREFDAALAVSKLAPAQDEESIFDALSKLALEYEWVRANMDATPKRTARMNLIMRAMRALALVGYNQLSTFKAGATAGERLVAIAMLQVRPDASHFGWLLDRIALERPFVGFQAIEALHRAAMESRSDDRESLRTLLGEWVNIPEGARALRMGNDRSDLLQFVLKQLDIPVDVAPG